MSHEDFVKGRQPVYDKTEEETKGIRERIGRLSDTLDSMCEDDSMFALQLRQYRTVLENSFANIQMTALSILAGSIAASVAGESAENYEEVMADLLSGIEKEMCLLLEHSEHTVKMGARTMADVAGARRRK